MNIFTKGIIAATAMTACISGMALSCPTTLNTLAFVKTQQPTAAQQARLHKVYVLSMQRLNMDIPTPWAFLGFQDNAIWSGMALDPQGRMLPPSGQLNLVTDLHLPLPGADGCIYQVQGTNVDALIMGISPQIPSH